MENEDRNSSRGEGDQKEWKILQGDHSVDIVNDDANPNEHSFKRTEAVPQTFIQKKKSLATAANNRIWF